MGLFVCAKCSCVENTALGHWWSRNNRKLILPEDMEQFEKGLVYVLRVYQKKPSLAMENLRELKENGTLNFLK